MLFDFQHLHMYVEVFVADRFKLVGMLVGWLVSFPFPLLYFVLKGLKGILREFYMQEFRGCIKLAIST